MWSKGYTRLSAGEAHARGLLQAVLGKLGLVRQFEKLNPQRLKPGSVCMVFGMTEVMPCYKTAYLCIHQTTR
jgi:hypothetical protein